MSVLIKGVKMPKNCTLCPCASIDSAIKDSLGNEVFNMCCNVMHNYWTCYRYISGKPSWCPLVEVPTPHGRLIDESRMLFADITWCTDDDGIVHVDTPTIIEAEE